METSVLFLMHARRLWTAGGGELGGVRVVAADPTGGVESPDQAPQVVAAPPSRLQKRGRKSVARGSEIESPDDGALVSVASLGVTLFMAALWRLHRDGVVGLEFGEAHTPFRMSGAVSFETRVLPIQVTLEKKPRKKRLSLEGRLIEALAARDRADVVELGEEVADRDSYRAIMIGRAAAIDEGLLAPSEPETDGAVAIGFKKEPRQGVGRVFGAKSVPSYVAADRMKLRKLTPEFEQQNDAYVAYREANEGFENAISWDWHPHAGAGDTA